MRFPIKNCTGKPLSIFVEMETLEVLIPAAGTAIVTLSDNPASYFEVREGMIVVWNEGPAEATIEFEGRIRTFRNPN